MTWIAKNLWLIPFLPLLAAGLTSLMPQRMKRPSWMLAVGSMSGSFLLALCAFAATLGGAPAHGVDKGFNFDWFQFGGQWLQLGWVLDPLTAVMLVMVTFVGLLIFIFSIGYMAEDENFTRFFCFLSLFASAMLGVVIANSLLLLFVCWELVGLTSYLLIGFWYHKPSAAAAAKKAFITTRIGDLGLLIGMVWLYAESGTLLFYDDGAGCLEQTALTAMLAKGTAAGLAVSTAIGLLIFLGAVGKSGQLPLHVWLPDAMEGPTPVSALIHAATMVAAGVFLVARVFPLMAAGGVADHGAPVTTVLTVITWVGAATALFAATIAVAQNDIKRILAYSTVSQLGYMMMGLGVGGVAVGMFHLITHAFFKALLFLGSGSVIHGMHHEQDMRRMGNLKKYMPITFFTMVTGWLAIAGIPIFAGFFSKDEILYKTFAAQGLGSWNYILWGIGIVTAVLTAVYMTRMMVMTFWGSERFHQELPEEEHADHDDDDHHEIPADFKPHESPWTMTVPLIALAILSTFGGLVGIPYALSSLPVVSSIVGKDANHFEHVLGEVVKPVGARKSQGAEGEVKHFLAEGSSEEGAAAHSPEEIAAERWLALFSVLLAAGGIAIGWFMFAGNPLRKMPKVLERKWYLDEVYNKAIVDPITEGSRRFLWKGFDLGIIDGTINGLGSFVTEMGSLVRRIQVGFVRSYAAIILFGALIVLGYFIYYAYRTIG